MNYTGCICCIAKYEDEYLKEWVDYHLKLGFDKIFIFQNDWRYSNNDISDDRVIFIDYDGEQVQNKCYNEFIFKYYNDFDFCAFIDCDEFIALRDNITLQEFWNKISNYELVYLNWRVFGDNGLLGVTNDDYSQIKRFTKCDDKLHRLGKNIINFRISKLKYVFNNPHIVLVNSHQIEFPSVILDTNGKTFPMEHPWDAPNNLPQCAELFHYRNKTYLERISKHGPGKSDAYWKNSPYDSQEFFDKSFDEYNTNVIEDLTAKEFMYGK